MKNAVLVLGIAVLFAGGCGQKSNQQTTPETGGGESLVTGDSGGTYQADKTAPFETESAGASGSHSDSVASLHGTRLTSVKTHNNIKDIGRWELGVEQHSWDWMGVKCKIHYHDDHSSATQECDFPNASLRQVYDIIKIVDKTFKTELPTTSFKDATLPYGCDGCDTVEIGYQYKSEKHLFIDAGNALLSPSGIISIEIIESSGSTRSKITYSFDEP